MKQKWMPFFIESPAIGAMRLIVPVTYNHRLIQSETPINVPELFRFKRDSELITASDSNGNFFQHFGPMRKWIVSPFSELAFSSSAFKMCV